MTFVSVLLLGLFLYVIYNLGQLLMAILFGIHNQHYFLGFNPKLIDFKIKDINISLGIYIPIFPFERIYKIENGEKVRMDLSWQFVTFPIWKRMLVSLAGVMSLLMASIIIFTIITYVQTEPYYSKDEINKLGIYPSELAVKAGFQKGDRIVLIDGKNFENFNELASTSEADSYTINRRGKTIEINISKGVYESIKHNRDKFIEPLMPFEIGKVKPNSPAFIAGLQERDKIIRVNDKPIFSLQELKYELDKDADGEVVLIVERFTNGEKENLSIPAKVDENKLLGFFPDILLKQSLKENTLIESIDKGFKLPFNLMYYNLIGLYKLFDGQSIEAKPISGPIGIAKAFGENGFWFRFWQITGLFSSITVLLNLLPLPRSAFWQLIPLAYEGITGKFLSYKTYSYIRKVPYVLLILLFAIAFINDIYHTFYR